jgi:hypothetical protein
MRFSSSHIHANRAVNPFSVIAITALTDRFHADLRHSSNGRALCMIVRKAFSFDSVNRYLRSFRFLQKLRFVILSIDRRQPRRMRRTAGRCLIAH